MVGNRLRHEGVTEWGDCLKYETLDAALGVIP